MRTKSAGDSVWDGVGNTMLGIVASGARNTISLAVAEVGGVTNVTVLEALGENVGSVTINDSRIWGRIIRDDKGGEQMITKLTEEQEALLPVYRDKWLAIGLCTEPADRPTAEQGIHEAYQAAGIKTKPAIVWCGSPLSAAFTRAIFMAIKDALAEAEKDAGESVAERTKADIARGVWDAMTGLANSHVDNAVWNSAGKSSLYRMRDAVKGAVGDNVEVNKEMLEKLEATVAESVKNSVNESGYGQHDAHWLGFYDYFGEVLGLKEETAPLHGLQMVAKSAGWYIPHENICWISERHNVCKLKDGQIHCDGGPAIAYPDGWSVWALNGVRVPQWLAETPAEEIDCIEFAKIENVEVRREFIRKVGIERLCTKLKSEILDKSGDYELHLIDLDGDTGKWPYLKMLNPSIGVWHMECVARECTTVEQALKWRNQSELVPDTLT